MTDEKKYTKKDMIRSARFGVLATLIMDAFIVYALILYRIVGWI